MPSHTRSFHFIPQHRHPTTSKRSKRCCGLSRGTFRPFSRPMWWVVITQSWHCCHCSMLPKNCSNLWLPARFRPRVQVIVTSSIAVWIRVVYPNLPYVVSKVALTQMVETLSTTLTPHGIRIDSSALSVYTAEHISNVYGDYEQITSYGSILKELTPLAKTGGVEDLVWLIVCMANFAAGNFNISIMVSDGGHWVWCCRTIIPFKTRYSVNASVYTASWTIYLISSNQIIKAKSHIVAPSRWIR